MAVGVQKAHSVTASDNANADSNINYAEGQTPASLNNSARAHMASIKGFANQILGAKTTGGSADAQTFTSDAVAAISTAYAAGMGFVFRAGYTNTGAATFNVDGVGAKSFKKGGALSDLVAGDIVAGGIYFAVYQATGDCFVLLNPEKGQIAAGFQPLDATLTALAALSWSSGNALVQFTAADTVSLTLAPSVTSVTASNGAGATTPAGSFKNTTDNAAVQVAIFEGDRATPAANDSGYVTYRLSDSAGSQDEFARWTWRGSSVTSTSETAEVLLGMISAGSLANRYLWEVGAYSPNVSDGASLGTTTRMWSDGFWASGAVHNFNNGNVVLTHVNSTATLEATTGALISKLTQVASVNGTLVAATHRNRELQLNGNITLPNSTMAAGDWHVLRSDGSDRTITRGSGVTMYVNGVDSASATLPARLIGGVLWDTASICHLTGPIY